MMKGVVPVRLPRTKFEQGLLQSRINSLYLEIDKVLSLVRKGHLTQRHGRLLIANHRGEIENLRKKIADGKAPGFDVRYGIKQRFDLRPDYSRIRHPKVPAKKYIPTPAPPVVNVPSKPLIPLKPQLPQKPKPKPKPQPKPEPKPKPKPEPKPEPKPGPEQPLPPLKPEPQPGPDTDIDFKPDLQIPGGSPVGMLHGRATRSRALAMRRNTPHSLSGIQGRNPYRARALAKARRGARLDLGAVNPRIDNSAPRMNPRKVLPSGRAANLQGTFAKTRRSMQRLLRK